MEFDLYSKAKVQSMTGVALSRLGHMEEALGILHTSLTAFDVAFPKSLILAKCYILKDRIRHSMRKLPLRFCKQQLAVCKKYYGDIAICLHRLCKVYQHFDQWEFAHVAAIINMLYAREIQENVIPLVNSFRSMMEIYLHNGNVDKCRALEKEAFRVCASILPEDMTRTLFEKIAYLHFSIFNANFLRGEGFQAAGIGLLALQLSYKMKNPELKISILPLLIHNLVMRHKMYEAVELLHELRIFAERSSNKTATTWYYILCLDMLLETGFAVEKYKVCQKFANNLKDSKTFLMDKSVMQRLIVDMWLWSIRRNVPDEAKDWKKYVDISTISPECNYSNILIYLRVLECHLLIAVSKINNTDFEGYNAGVEQAKIITRKLKKCVRNCKFGKPR